MSRGPLWATPAPTMRPIQDTRPKVGGDPSSALPLLLCGDLDPQGLLGRFPALDLVPDLFVPQDPPEGSNREAIGLRRQDLENELPPDLRDQQLELLKAETPKKPR